MSIRAPFPWRAYLHAALVILLISGAPLLSVSLASVIATIGDCKAIEARVLPCVILGVDLGWLVYGLGIMGWLMLLSLPFGAMALPVLVLVVTAHYLLWQRQR